MSTVAVVAHPRKSFGGGFGELREVLGREGLGELFITSAAKPR